MYNLPYFKANDEKEVIDFINHHPFVIITGVDVNDLPVATHVPILIEERQGKLFFLAHIMKQTEHYKAFVQHSNVLVIFSGAHTYVSASWYKDQQQASTWNYQAVHATGKLKFLDAEALQNILHRLTEKFENNVSSPSLVKNLPAEYITRLMKAIVGFEIEVTDIAHVFKLSQNRDTESYQSIINHLDQGDSDARQIASIMQKNVRQ